MVNEWTIMLPDTHKEQASNVYQHSGSQSGLRDTFKFLECGPN